MNHIHRLLALLIEHADSGDLDKLGHDLRVLQSDALDADARCTAYWDQMFAERQERNAPDPNDGPLVAEMKAAFREVDRKWSEER